MIAYLMKEDREFLLALINHLPDEIVVLDHTGRIVIANASWTHFFSNTSHDQENYTSNDWLGYDYLNECRIASIHDPDFENLYSGIQNVLNGRLNYFHCDYPYQKIDDQHWYSLRAQRLQFEEQLFCVISHRDITERKVAELMLEDLSNRDSLTGLLNRRAFNSHLVDAWRTCRIAQLPLSLAIIDVDNFKLVNDHFGHPVGDKYLLHIATLLNHYAQEANIECFRYGGDEFTLIWKDADHLNIVEALNKLNAQLASVMPNESKHTPFALSLSVGLNTVLPNEATHYLDILKEADKLVYRAKLNGRNRVECGHWKQQIQLDLLSKLVSA